MKLQVLTILLIIVVYLYNIILPEPLMRLIMVLTHVHVRLCFVSCKFEKFTITIHNGLQGIIVVLCLY